MNAEHVVILGAGFAGLELATCLSESLGDEVRVTLLDESPSFSFGFAKLDVLFGRKQRAEVELPYAAIAREGVEFRQERVTAIDPERRRVTTEQGAYEADVLAVALGAAYDPAATPGFGEGGVEFYSLAGAERMRETLVGFEAGTILLGILGHPFKCPPAPFEGALLLHDHFVARGVRDRVELRVIAPMAAPVPISPGVSARILDALREREIEYVGNELVTEVDVARGEARLRSGDSASFDLFVGVPVHRAPDVVVESGLAVDGWVPVETANLATRFDRVYALGDIAGAPVAKAGVFAEAAARVVAADIVARLRGGEAPEPWQGTGNCYIEFGGGLVGKVEANFLGGPAPTAELIGPSRELAADKEAFGAARRARWFGL